MRSRYIEAAGDLISVGDLAVPKAQDLAIRMVDGEIPDADLVECRRLKSVETVVFDVRLEVPNRRAYPIRRLERIAASFTKVDDAVPNVEVLRDDFPRVPHLNLNQQEVPASLCLYDQPYSDLKRRWTSGRFVRRVREWLELTSRGRLHAENQELEPLLVDFAGVVVLPHDYHDACDEKLIVVGDLPKDQKWFFSVQHRDPDVKINGPTAVLSSLTCEPTVHGILRRTPRTIHELAEISKDAGLDLVSALRNRLPAWRDKALESHVLLVLSFPRTRTDGGSIEHVERWCFVTSETVRDLSVMLGMWDTVKGNTGPLAIADENKQGQEAGILVLNSCVELTNSSAACLNGLTMAHDMRLVGVGAGALGSQITMNLARSGFGRWTLIDHDRLLPHNLARHALPGYLTGWNKAQATAKFADSITRDEGSFRGLGLSLQENSDEVKQALDEADVVIDMTASIGAQRFVSRSVRSTARRLCVFLTPLGSDLVIMAEDTKRKVPLDALEMQYYRALVHDELLDGHLQSNGNHQRYGRSCGDTTSHIPQDLVALHAAIASRAVKELTACDEPFIGLWRADQDSAVKHVPIEVRKVTEFCVDAWTVVIDDGLRDRLTRDREEKLPNETGGIILGTFDMASNTLFLVDTLPSPPDSDEQRGLYIRGCQGLREKVEAVERKTGGMLEYVGEWHSHPRGASTRPSDVDLSAFAGLRKLMTMDGLPAVMMIVGDGRDASLFVDTIRKQEALIPESSQ